MGTGMVICLERDADLHMAQLMPLTLTVSCFSKIQIGFTFLVVLEKGPLNVCVCVHAHARTKQQHVTFNLPTTLEYDLSFIVFQKHRLLSPLIRLLSFFSL